MRILVVDDIWTRPRRLNLGMPEDLRRTREAGFSAHLVKPVSTDALRELLERL
ncbi:MAG TPA: hypothetical protein VFB93_19060 [Burkholderiales bacterium]|nr:hypothetical protein [Burkholderiales bacterium]